MITIEIKSFDGENKSEKETSESNLKQRNEIFNINISHFQL